MNSKIMPPPRRSYPALFRRSVTLCLALLSVAWCLGGCGAGASIKSSQTTCTQFMQQMQAGQTASAYNLCSAACKGVTTQAQMQNYWNLLTQNKGAVQSWTQQSFFVSSSTSGSSVQLVYNLQCANGTAAVRFTCAPDNDQWLIQNFIFRG